MYHEAAEFEVNLKKLPYFNIIRALEYGKKSVIEITNNTGEVDEDLMKKVKENHSLNLECGWFLTKLFMEQQPSRIETETSKVDNFEKSFNKTTSDERTALDLFKRNQDDNYCTPNYSVIYAQYCAQLNGNPLEQIGKIIRDIKNG